jgi:DNA-binding PadR family transcriptional regulator
VRGSLTTTSYALLGLLAFDQGSTSRGLTGYELKQRADNTLRFYWVSPAMSQIYTELARLATAGAVVATLGAAADDDSAASDRATGDPLLDDDPPAGGSAVGVHTQRRTRRYRITTAGLRELRTWLNLPAPEFPVLKHPVALRLLMGHLMEPNRVVAMLEEYLGSVGRRRAELEVVRDSLGDDDAYRYPKLVAGWGISYYDAEESIIRDMLSQAPGSPARPC